MQSIKENETQSEDFFEHKEKMAQKGKSRIFVLGLISLAISLIIIIIFIISNFFNELSFLSVVLVPVILFACYYYSYFQYNDYMSEDSKMARIGLIIMIAFIIMLNLYQILMISNNKIVTLGMYYRHFILNEENLTMSSDINLVKCALLVHSLMDCVIITILVKSKSIKEYLEVL